MAYFPVVSPNHGALVYRLLIALYLRTLNIYIPSESTVTEEVSTAMLRGKDRPMPGPTYMSKEQKGQQSHMSHSSTPHSPQRPSRLRDCISLQQAGLQSAHAAQYLDNLRSNRSSRPSGSRPPPPSRFSTLKRSETAADANPQWNEARPSLPTSNSMPIMPPRADAHRRNDSSSSSKNMFAGRPLVRPPSATPLEEEPPSPSGQPPPQQRPSTMYMERGTRWMERQEVKSLRMALEDMDLDDEQKVHSAAQDEAAELVWKHQNPDAPSANPDAPYRFPDVSRDYRSHLRKGSYQRSHSQDAVPILAQRSASGSSQESSNKGSITSKRKSMDVLRKVSPPSGTMAVKKTRTPSGKSFGGLAEAVADDIAKAQRRTSSGNKRILSGEKEVYMHPNDRIWEDPQEVEHALPKPLIVDPPKPAEPVQQPAHIRKNPFARVRMQAEKLERSNSEPILNTSMPMHHSVEIQKNSPSQGRRPWYMSNEPLPPTPPSAGDRAADEVEPKVTPTKEGKEVRGDDIRAATSKQRKDYSPKLPRPTVVSDKPGRPIVSFKQDWKPKEVVLEEVKAAPSEPSKASHDFQRPNNGAPVPQICVDEAPKPPIPTINFPDGPEVPNIVLPEEPGSAVLSITQSSPLTPTISVNPPSINVQSPMININGPESAPAPDSRSRDPQRPLPRHAATSPLPKSTPHYTPSVRQSNALCAHCALPIAGRILSAAGERFHPECFVCHQCNTNLECVAFYPEPEKQRSERLVRIAARQSGVEIPNSEGMSAEQMYQLEVDDGDETLRFYCHLDFHELFSPRCKSCKTPVEGEVIVACGAEWHVGHFFCAQCGDPFDSSTPFVEKDGYAWCVGCHTNRYSSKCRKCRKPVTDTVVKALGHDWHGNCFVCMVSSFFAPRCWL